MGMNMHRLLEKQIKKYLTPECLNNEPFMTFLSAVNNSYNGYDRDQALSAHAFRISEQEYMEINQRLKDELSIRERGLKSLKELIKRLGELPGTPTVDYEDDLLITLKYLENHIEQRNKIENELKRLSLVASVNENGVIFTDPEGIIFWTNEGFSRLTGYSMQEIIGKTPVELCKGQLSDSESIKSMIDAFMTGQTFSVEVAHYRKNNSWFWAKLKGQAILDEKGAVTQYFVVVEDISKAKEAEDLLRKNEEKYRGIISNMNFGLIEVDLEDRIQFVNQSFCEISGFQLHELYGRHAAALFMTKDDQQLIVEKNAMRLDGIADAYEMEVRNRKGEKRWWLISGAPRYNDLGKVVGSIGIHLDITEQKRLQHDLIEARRHAEELSRIKEAFLTNMSHEIRTPMNAILGMARQLKKTILDQKQQLYLDTINMAAENLLVVINDILDISKIEAGKLIIEHIGFRMEDILTRATRVMLHKAEEKGLKLSFFADKKIHPVLLGDPYRLNQIMLNLLSNAIKFTEKGTVTIHCKIKRKEDSRDIVYISITDTGIGMDGTFLQNVFRKFYQEDVSVARKYGGTGLGMSICRELTELMQGTIEVMSVKGKGTKVTLCIPFERGAETDLPVKEEAVSDTTVLNGKKILLVEDNEMNRMVATMILNNYGASVFEAVNGEEAVESIRNNRYDLVLMDMQMPVMGGLEATRIIRETIDASIPVIALTANAIKGENDKCLAAGMNDYISKPFEENELINMITNWLGKKPGAAHLNPKTAEDIPLYSLEKLEKIGHGDEVFVKKMLYLFLQEVPPTVEAIKVAYKARDFATVHACAHRIKPILGNLCVVSLKEDILEIERTALKRRTSQHLEQLIQKLDSTIARVTNGIRSYLEEHAGSTI